MTFKSALIGLTLLLLAAFVALNWEAIAAATPISLGFTQIQAPLGLILLSFCLLLCVLFLTYVLVLQATVIMDTRRATKDMHQQRELADKAEASRFTQMGTLVETQIQQASTQQLAAVAQLTARVDRLEQVWDKALSESTSTLSAYIGEVEDKLDRALPAPGQ